MSAITQPDSERTVPKYTVIEDVARLRVPAEIHPTVYAGYIRAGPATATQLAQRADIAAIRSSTHGMSPDPIEAWTALWKQIMSPSARGDAVNLVRKLGFKFSLKLSATKHDRYAYEYWSPVSLDGWSAWMILSPTCPLERPGISITWAPLTEPLRELFVPGWIHPAVWALRQWSLAELRDGCAEKFGVPLDDPDEGARAITAAQDTHGLAADVDAAWGQLWRQEQEGGAGFEGVAEAMVIGFRNVPAPVLGDLRWEPVWIRD